LVDAATGVQSAWKVWASFVVSIAPPKQTSLEVDGGLCQTKSEKNSAKPANAPREGTFFGQTAVFRAEEVCSEQQVPDDTNNRQKSRREVFSVLKSVPV